MTSHREFKDRVRTRMLVTGETYTAARAALASERERLNAISEETSPGASSAGDRSETGTPAAVAANDAMSAYATEPLAAIVPKVNRQSARVRIIGESTAITLRGPGQYNMIPGQVASIVVTKRWKYREHEYATGAAGEKRIDVAALGLEPLPLEDLGVYDIRKSSEPFRAPDPYAPMWRTLTKQARRAFEFDRIAWEGGRGPSQSDDDLDVDLPVCDAAELISAGDYVGAAEILMNVLANDLRCIDAHAHLGNIEFRHGDLKRALQHYEIGVGIGDLSLGSGFKDLLPWGHTFNRPFLRCLHGLGLTRWRLGRFGDAIAVFERMLALNPNDNQGVRFLLADVRGRRTWEEHSRREDEREAVAVRSLRAGATLH
jgi:tetratricopeptide (TPR) repeat protein